MSDILLTLFTVTEVAALVALFMALKPGFSERTRQTAFHVFTATTLLSGVARLATGHTFFGAVLAAGAILLLMIRPLARLVRWARARNDEKSKE
ncbi:hypothetical protein ACFYY1_39210 [Streptomyces sp. NPDC001890]|uniref:hypothetical protein n=1 Tax=Streptomyces sp. NPDC001890 TaxID=3364620 RepID=UPI0036B4D9D3